MIRLGIVDFDSSHSVEFTRRFNQINIAADQFVEGAKVVCGCPGSSEMAPERIGYFRSQIDAFGVEIVESPNDMLGRIDAVLILSLCGTAHLERVRPFLEAGVPAFVDKPFACSVDDASEMVQLANDNSTMLLTSSALRFAQEVQQFQRNTLVGAVHGVITYGPAKRADGNPGLFHYGIHPTELLFCLMGSGCKRVSTIFTDGAELCTAEWRDGRIATLRGLRCGSTNYGFTAFCENAIIQQEVSSRFAYRNLCRAVVDSIQQQQPVVSNEESLELVQFIVASQHSESRDGEWVNLN